jgi:hypothetical protein
VEVLCDRDYSVLMDDQHEALVRVQAILSRDADAVVLLGVRWFEALDRVDKRSGLPEYKLCARDAYSQIISPTAVLRPAALFHLCGGACQPSDDGAGFVHSAAGNFVHNTYVYNILRL